MTTVLICDDDPVQRRLVEAMVRKLGHDARICENGEQALQMLREEGETVDLVLLDLVMPERDGMGVLAAMREEGLVKPVIVQTSQGGIDTVVNAMRAGATDFVVKPVGAERLSVSIRNALKTEALAAEVQRLKRKVEGTMTFKDIVTRSPRMQPVLKVAEKAAGSMIPVMIEGESGVGKELLARAIAGSGERRSKAFVAVNCGAIPQNLVESILFGHEKGAFTGATEKHTGKFVEAHGGTLFLDEVGELPLETQVKLLRAIQEGEVDPVGAKRSVKVDIRIISATNRDLIRAVKEGRFREDLYYRLCVFPITLPPLRERAEDIPDLVRHFLARISVEEGKRIRAVQPAVLGLLSAYPWPGNVRQLENAVFRAVVLCDGDELSVADFPQIAAQVDGYEVVVPLAPPVVAAPALQPGAMAQPAMIVTGASIGLLDEAGHARTMEALETEAIRFAIDHYRGQMSQVARRLGIGRSTLYRKLKELGIEDRDEEQV
ncbi:sigma-54-dependent transcriptional regulator [Phreatobacter sp.]|uniref:sigma-54-dependent transcriptional regulator n=1 Tax=Phreatobacter sp. TaxID=1966341 RepID=UPI003F71ECD3